MKALLFGLLALLPSISMAGGTYGPNPLLTIGSEQLLPHRGGYWDPTASGSGYFVDVMRRPDGTVFGFATIYTYDAEGRSTFMTMQGPLQFASETQRQNEGWFAKLVSGTFTAANGQTFLGAYRSPAVGPSPFGAAELVWDTRRTAELRVSGRVIKIRALHPETPATEAANLVAGYWNVRTRIRGPSPTPAGSFFHPSGQQYHSFVVKVTQVPTSVWSVGNGSFVLPLSVFQTFWQPPANVLTFDVTCVSECLPSSPPVFGSAGAMIYTGARVWIDPVTLRAGWVVNAVVNAGQTLTPQLTHLDSSRDTTRVFDLYVDDDTAIGRGMTLFTDRTSASFAVGAYPGSEFIMTRIRQEGLHAPAGQEVKIY